MEEKYWNEFMESGKIMDYLYSKGMGICSQVMDKYNRGGDTEKYDESMTVDTGSYMGTNQKDR